MGSALSLSEMVIVPTTASNSTSGGAIMHWVMRDIAESFDSSPKNGTAATLGEMLSVDLPRQRNRVALADSAQYLGYRKAVIDFLHTRQVHVEKAA